MIFALPKLPYELTALQPYISAKTLEFHYGKHHQAYVNNLNNLVQGTRFENSDLETIVKESDGAIYNNAAQVWNHSFYFDSLGPQSSYSPDGKFAEAIKDSFGSMADLKEAIIKAGVSLFGSGWVWLVKNPQGSLEILQEGNAGNPMRKGLEPVLTCDVWEHAYYLDYQNRRLDHINALWNVIDWQKIEKRFLEEN